MQKSKWTTVLRWLSGYSWFVFLLFGILILWDFLTGDHFFVYRLSIFTMLLHWMAASILRPARKEDVAVYPTGLLVAGAFLVLGLGAGFSTALYLSDIEASWVWPTLAYHAIYLSVVLISMLVVIVKQMSIAMNGTVAEMGDAQGKGSVRQPTEQT